MLSFRHTKQTSKNVADALFIFDNYSTNKNFSFKANDRRCQLLAFTLSLSQVVPLSESERI